MPPIRNRGTTPLRIGGRRQTETGARRPPLTAVTALLRSIRKYSAVRPRALSFLAIVVFASSAFAQLQVNSFQTQGVVGIGGKLSVYISASTAAPSVITITHALPAGTTFDHVTTGTTTTCTTPTAGATGTVTCHNTTGSIIAFWVISNVSSSVAAGTALTYSFIITSGTDTLTKSATTYVRKIPTFDVTSTMPSTFVAGAPIDYTLTIRNTSTVDAQDIVIDEVCTYEVRFVSVTQLSGPRLDCGMETDTDIRCGWAPLPAGQQVKYAVRLLSPSYAIGMSVRDCTWIALPAYGDDATTVTCSPGNVGTEVADLKVTSSAPATVAVGDTISFTINVTNTGPSDAPDGAVTWTTPSGTTFVSAPSYCTAPAVGSSGTVTCNSQFPGPDDWGIASTMLTMVVRATTPGLATATATGTCPHDPVTTNNSATSTTTILAQGSADLSVSLTGPAFAYANQEPSWDFVVTNIGPTVADDVHLTFSLPPTAWLRNAPSTACTTTLCNVGPLQAGSSVSGTLTANAWTGTRSLSVAASSSTSDPNPSNNSASVSTTFYSSQPSATLQALATPNVFVTPGGTVVYAATIANTGKDPLVSTLDVTLPAAAQFASTTAGCSAPQVSAGTVSERCTLPPIAASASTTLAFNVTAPFALGPFTATFHLTYDATAGKTATSVLNVAPPPPVTADLATWITTAAIVAPGGTAPLAFGIRNIGPDPAASPQLTLTPPAGAVVDGIHASAGWSCSGTTAIVCTSTSLAVGAAVDVDASAHVSAPEGSTLRYGVTASSSTYDPSAPNNAASATTLVAIPADLSLRVDPSAIATVKGASIRFTAVVTNSGSGRANHVRVYGVASGIALTSASGSGVECHTTGGGFDCTMISLDPAAVARIDLAGVVGSSKTATVDMVASCESPEVGTTNNAATLPLTIGEPHHRAAGH